MVPNLCTSKYVHSCSFALWTKSELLVHVNHMHLLLWHDTLESIVYWRVPQSLLDPPHPFWACFTFSTVWHSFISRYDLCLVTFFFYIFILTYGIKSAPLLSAFDMRFMLRLQVWRKLSSELCYKWHTLPLESARRHSKYGFESLFLRPSVLPSVRKVK